MPITWLHLSDLHRGQGGDNRWPRARVAFLKDLETKAKDLGTKPDLVFFTGDLAFSGHPDQYDLVEQTIEDIRKVLGEFVVVPVPGNHDLARPHKSDLAAIACERYFTDDRCRDGVRGGLPTTLEFFERLFKNYTLWFRNHVQPSWDGAFKEYQLGLLPGDFVATFARGDLTLGLAGINSAFLDHRDGVDGDLAIEVEQIAAKTDPTAWRAKHDACLLLMHHPWSSLHQTARRVLYQELYTPDEFVACFCGHMHEAIDFEMKGPDGGIRRITQANSLFGLEKLPSGEERRSGYAWGQLERDGDAIVLRRWPRRAQLNENSTWVLDRIVDSDPAVIRVESKKKGR